jgi:hypothetical protein
LHETNKFFVALAALFIFFEQNASAQFYFYDNDHYDTPLMFEVGRICRGNELLIRCGGKKRKGRPFVKDLNIGNNQFNGSIYLKCAL